MSILIKNYKLSESNASKKNAQRPSITVRNHLGQICARVFGEKGRMLHRIQNDLTCKERHELIEKLTLVGVPEEDIHAIVTPQK